MATTANRSTDPTQRIGVRYGVLSAVAMILYFIVINLLDLQDSELVRFGSNLFIIGAVVLAIRALKKNYGNSNRQTPYLPGLAIGFLVGLLGSALFAAFILANATLFNPDYAGVMAKQDYYGIQLPLLMVAGSVVILGTATGAMTGYILMMAFDNSGGQFSKDS
jgi:hypothetical protein